MNEFDTAKVGFVLALLGAIFAINPLIENITDLGFQLFGIGVTIGAAYAVMASFLCIATYAFAIDYLTSKPSRIARRAGNGAYVIALLVPPLFIVGWGITLFATWLINTIDIEEIAVFISGISNLITAIIGAITGFLITSLISNRDKRIQSTALEAEEAKRITRANEMLSAKHYDLAVIEAARSLESSLQRALVAKGKPPNKKGLLSLIDAAAHLQIIPHEYVGIAHEIRICRNNAVHNEGQVSEETAYMLVNSTLEVLGSIVHINEFDDDIGSEDEN